MNFKKEKPISLAESARYFPKRPSTSSLWRWSTRGVRGVRLESFCIGGKRYTTEKAVGRFLSTLNLRVPTNTEADAELMASGL